MTADFDPSLFHWTPQPIAAKYVQSKLDAALTNSPWLGEFKSRLLGQTGTRLVDWLDHIVVDSTDGLADVGYEKHEGAWRHPLGLFPEIVVASQETSLLPQLAVKVDSVGTFLKTHEADFRFGQRVSGDDQLRMAVVQFEGGSSLRVVERHGYRGLSKVAADVPPAEPALELFRNRPRPYGDAETGFEAATDLFRKATDLVGRDRACDLFFQSEREYWQSKNQAARIQYDRQQSLGLGWANHDHHTYRCSRVWFAPLVEFLELAGFQCRERFYAGADAGWGAQVLEHPICGIVIFADVDMSEEEVVGDFAHHGLVETTDLGTVGLWCQLHGDSFLAAGMHHLECQFDFDASRTQLAECGIASMAPFTDFPYLKQAFTKGESWAVPKERLSALVERGAIDQQEADRMLAEGAIGSHLEILERNDGFKGFNQTGISQIILETNPANVAD